MSAPKGTFDLLPPESAVFLAVRDGLAAPLRRAGYGYVETPVFEDTALFERGVGESTDVVTQGDVHLHRRAATGPSDAAPEGTAGVLRSVTRARPATGRAAGQALVLRARSSAYERPQAGRYRHFSRSAPRRSASTTRPWTPSSIALARTTLTGGSA